MVKFYDSIPDNLTKWILDQHLFWVASAPLSPDSHVNVSPKGMKGTFHVESPNRVWYEDLTGSGSETVAHIRENGRITVCFSAFTGPPRILRLFGKAIAHEFGTPEYAGFIPTKEERAPGSRAVIVIDVHRVSTSCGFGVPRYDLIEERQLMPNWGASKEKHDTDLTFSSGNNERKEAEFGIRAWWRAYADSIDGLPGLRSCFDAERPLEYAGVHSRARNEKQAMDAFMEEYKASGGELEEEEDANDGKAEEVAIKRLDPPKVKTDMIVSGRMDRDQCVIIGFTAGLFAAALMETALAFARKSR